MLGSAGASGCNSPGLLYHCIALAIRKETFGLDCLQRSHDCAVR
jgi:hypothetical protein